MRQIRHSGFSLLEVMLATTVLLGSVVVLSHISFVGRAHMDAAEQYSAAQLVCQARMNEMLAGALPINEVRSQAIPDLPGWGLSVKVNSASRPGLLALEVTAQELATDVPTDVSSQTVDATGSTPQQAVGAGKRFTLVRWIAEPEGSNRSSGLSTRSTASPVDIPMEASLFDDSFLPGDTLFPEESMPPAGAFLPEEPLLPEEPSLFEEPLPEF